MLMEEIKENLYKWRDILLIKRENKSHSAQRDEAEQKAEEKNQTEDRCLNKSLHIELCNCYPLIMLGVYFPGDQRVILGGKWGGLCCGVGFSI